MIFDPSGFQSPYYGDSPFWCRLSHATVFLSHLCSWGSLPPVHSPVSLFSFLPHLTLPTLFSVVSSLHLVVEFVLPFFRSFSGLFTLSKCYLIVSVGLSEVRVLLVCYFPHFDFWHLVYNVSWYESFWVYPSWSSYSYMELLGCPYSCL